MGSGSAGKVWLIGSILMVGLVALLGGVVWADQHLRIEPPPSAPIKLELSREHAYPTFAVLGDDYAAGYGPGWSSSWVRLLGDEMCWTLMPVSGQQGSGIEGGTGFTTAGRDPGRARYFDRAATVAAGSPQILLVEGGNNDQGGPTSEEVTDAAAKTFTALKEQAGNGTVIAIGPLTTANPNAGQEAARVSAAIATAAAVAGIPYIDPVAEQWLADPAMFGADQMYPTTDGYREYTARLIDKLNSIGVASACTN